MLLEAAFHLISIFSILDLNRRVRNKITIKQHSTLPAHSADVLKKHASVAIRRNHTGSQPILTYVWGESLLSWTTLEDFDDKNKKTPLRRLVNSRNPSFVSGELVVKRGLPQEDDELHWKVPKKPDYYERDPLHVSL